LRAKAINSLVTQCAKAFIDNHDDLLTGKFDKHLLDCIPTSQAMDKIKELAFAKIYNYRKAMEIEAAGFEVLGGLMKAFLKAVFLDTKHDKQIRTLIPKQYLNPELSKYDKIMNIIQFVSGMTDTFALDTFRAIKGISLPSY